MAKYVTMQHIFFDYTPSEERVIADYYDDFSLLLGCKQAMTLALNIKNVIEKEKGYKNGN